MYEKISLAASGAKPGVLLSTAELTRRLDPWMSHWKELPWQDLSCMRKRCRSLKFKAGEGASERGHGE